jgi:hypothetical protein
MAGDLIHWTQHGPIWQVYLVLFVLALIGSLLIMSMLPRRKVWRLHPKKKVAEVKRAQYEIDLVGLSDQDSDYNGMIGDAVMQLIRLFSAQGHSGFSASHDRFNLLHVGPGQSPDTRYE